MKQSLIKVRLGYLPLIFLAVVVTVSFTWVAISDFDFFIYFSIHLLWICLLPLYIYLQAYNTVFELYEDELLVRFPFRPFLNRNTFLLKDIVLFKFINLNLGKLNPSVQIQCNNRRFKKYNFGFTGDAAEMNKLIELLTEKGVPTEVFVPTGRLFKKK